MIVQIGQRDEDLGEKINRWDFLKVNSLEAKYSKEGRKEALHRAKNWEGRAKFPKSKNTF